MHIRRSPPEGMIRTRDEILPVGKLPATLLAGLLARAPIDDASIVLGPGIGLDCAVVDIGDRLLVLKSDPITFVSDELGHYLVQINANDLATTGATPRWLLMTVLLPDKGATAALAERIFDQVYTACRTIGVSVVGGHTEITHGLDRPLAVGTLIGEVSRGRLVTPRGARPGDSLLLTKGVPIEGTSILAREFAERLRGVLTEDELREAREFLVDPGIGVLRDARLALDAGRVTAMHDPTEGGLAAALWELAEASGRSLRVDPQAVPVPVLSARICAHFGIDPLATIASGALLLTTPTEDSARIRAALGRAGVPCTVIGAVGPGPTGVWRWDGEPWPYPERDGIAQVYAATGRDAG